MKMEEHYDIEQFDRYLENQMTEAEKSAFEQKLRTDRAFAESFELQKEARLAARLDGREALKKQLRERQLAQPQEVVVLPGKDWQWFLAGLLVVAVLIFCWETFLDPNVRNQPNQAAPPEKTAPTEQPKTSEPTKPTQPIAEVPSEKQPARPDTERLFAANFKPFQNDEISGMLRSDDGPDAFQLFLAAYLRGSHAEALRLFENLSGEDKSNENIQFLKANSLLATGQAAAALPILERICLEKNTRFLTEAQWLLALAYLKTGDLKNARSTLNFIKTAASEQLPHAREAAEILKKL